MVQEIARLKAQAETLQALNDERKAAQAARTRKHRNAVSRDVTLQDVTERDGSSPSSPPLSSFPTPHITLTPPPPPSPARPTRTIRVLPSASPDILAVVEHYRKTHPKRRPGAKDEKAIAKALALGYSAGELCEAITGNALSDWHRDKKKHDLPYVLRSNGEIDNFRAKSVEPPMYDFVNECLTDYGERRTRPTG